MDNIGRNAIVPNKNSEAERLKTKANKNNIITKCAKPKNNSCTESNFSFIRQSIPPVSRPKPCN